MVGVLVLRPEEVARRTAQRLRERGHDPVVAPLLTIRATGEARPDGPFDGVVVTSPNAFEALGPADLAAVVALPLLAVGERTGEAARRAGFTAVTAAAGDRIALAALAPSVFVAGARLLLVLGRDHKPDTPSLLEEAGFMVVPWIAYAAEAEGALPEAAVAALGRGAVSVALHYSRRSAGLALSLAERAGCGEVFRALRHLCLSEDVAAPLRAAGARVVEAAAVPHEDALLALLPADGDS